MSGVQSAGPCKLVISIDNADTYKGMIVVWFAEAATKIMLNSSLASITSQEHLKQIANMANRFVKIDTHPCDFVLLTSNELRNPSKKNLFQLNISIQTLQDPQEAQKEIELLPAFSLEFLEYIRKVFPEAKDKYAKRHTIFVKRDLLALAVLGAYLTYYYKEIKDNTVRYYYILADTLQLGAVNLSCLNEKVRNMSRVLREGDASPITLYVGIASLYANTISQLEEGSAILTHIVITGMGKGKSDKGKCIDVYRPTLLSFDQRDLTNLARDIKSLGWSRAIEDLVMSYPILRPDDSEDVKRSKRAVKNFIESLTRAVYVWHSTDDEQEIYRVLRTLTSDDFDAKARSYLGNKWNTIRSRLINIRI